MILKLMNSEVLQINIEFEWTHSVRIGAYQNRCTQIDVKMCV